MKKLPLFVLVVLAASFWLSSIAIFIIGSTQEHLRVMKWVALADGVGALFFTWLAVRRWTVQ